MKYIILGVLLIILCYFIKKSTKKEGYITPLQKAINACNSIGGWRVSWTNPNQKAIVCTKGRVNHGSNCNKCDTWRLYVAQDGGCDMSPPPGNNCPKNKAGNYYCGHVPCSPGDNYPHGSGAWKQPSKFALQQAQVSGNIVTYNGYQYRSLLGNPPLGAYVGRCESQGGVIPPGWEIAPDNNDSMHIAKNYSFQNHVLVFANGHGVQSKGWGWPSSPTAGQTYTRGGMRKYGNNIRTTFCSGAILLRRKAVNGAQQGGKSNKYTKMPKNTNCPAGTLIPTNPECQQAIRDLGLKYDPWWHGNHDQIPAGCTWTDAVLNNPHRGSLSHWNAWTYGAGKPRYDLHPICKTQPQGGILDYAPHSIKEIINKTYIGPSSEDSQLCKKLGKGNQPCGNVSGKGNARCIRNIASCKRFNGCGKHPNHCGTCMKRIPKAPPAPKKVNQAPGGDNIVKRSPCEWRNWTAWSLCDRQCAGGKQQRFRTNNGYCYSGGKKINSGSEERACNAHPCPRGPSGQKGEQGYRGPQGPVGDRGPVGKSGGVAGFPGESGIVGQKGSEGEVGYIGTRGEIGYQGPEGDVKSKAQINNNLLTSIYEKLLKMGGVEEEEFSLLSPYNTPKYN